MTRTLLSALRTVWYNFCIAVVAAFAYTVFRWMHGDSVVTHDIIIDCFSAFGIVFVVQIVADILMITLSNRKALRTESKAFIDGDADGIMKYYQKLERRAKGYDDKTELRLMLASFYSGELRYDEAFEALSSIELEKVQSEKVRAEFFNTAVYIYLLADDLTSAERLYVSGKALLEKYSFASVGNEFGAEITHTMAAMEYARGNIYCAERMFSEIMDESKSDRIVSACGIYLIMIYLATDRIEDAKVAAENIFPLICCRRDKQVLLRLMHCIENAYGIEASERN